jgi:hypothetical protein
MGGADSALQRSCHPPAPGKIYSRLALADTRQRYDDIIGGAAELDLTAYPGRAATWTRPLSQSVIVSVIGQPASASGSASGSGLGL